MTQPERSAWHADAVVDELLPGEFDWRRLVRRYPLVAVSVAAVGGYLLGSRHGEELVETVSGLVTDTFAENVQRTLGRK